MSHQHHHHHPHGHAHPPAVVAASILRLSVMQRLCIALAGIALIWAAVFWAMR
jgi:hypothetical protein